MSDSKEKDPGINEEFSSTKKPLSMWKLLKSSLNIFKKKKDPLIVEASSEIIYAERVACNASHIAGISKSVFKYHHITIYKQDEQTRCIQMKESKLSKDGELVIGNVVFTLRFNSQNSITEVLGNELDESAFRPKPKFAVKIINENITLLFFHELDKSKLVKALTIMRDENDYDKNHNNTDHYDNSAQPPDIYSNGEHLANEDEDEINSTIDCKNENLMQSTVMLPVKPLKSPVSTPPVKPFRDRSSPVEVIRLSAVATEITNKLKITTEDTSGDKLVSISRSRSNSGKSTPIMEEKIDLASQYSRSRSNSSKLMDSSTQIEHNTVDTASQYSRSRSNSSKLMDSSTQIEHHMVDTTSQYSRSRTNSGKLMDSSTQIEHNTVDTASQHSRSRSNSGKFNEKVDAASQHSKSRSNSGIINDRKEVGINCNLYSGSNSSKDHSTIAGDNDYTSDAFDDDDDDDNNNNNNNNEVYDANVMLKFAARNSEINYASDIRRISVSYPCSVQNENRTVASCSNNIGISTIADLVRLNQSISVSDEKAQDKQFEIENRLARAPIIETSSARCISVNVNQNGLKDNSDFYQSYINDQFDDEDAHVDYDSSSRSKNDPGENVYWNSGNNTESGMNESNNVEGISPFYAPKHTKFLRKSVCKYRYSPKKSFSSPKILTPPAGSPKILTPPDGSPKILTPPDGSQESVYFYHNKRLSVQYSTSVGSTKSNRSGRYSVADGEVKYGEGYILFKGTSNEWQPHYMCINVKGVLNLFKSHLDCKENTNTQRVMCITDKSTQLQVTSDVGFVVSNRSCISEFECYNSDEMKAWFAIMAKFIR